MLIENIKEIPGYADAPLLPLESLTDRLHSPVSGLFFVQKPEPGVTAVVPAGTIVTGACREGGRGVPRPWNATLISPGR